MKEIWRILKLVVLLVLVLGLAYPMVMVLYGRIDAGTADGGIISRNGRPVGSNIIGQRFTSEHFFQGRPSASDYDAMKSGPSNLGPSNPKLLADVETRVQVLLKQNPGLQRKDIPIELVTSSASGLDPEISPDSAVLQVPRVSKATGLSQANLRQMIKKHTRGRFLWTFGEPGVNVLELNLDVLATSGGGAK